MNYYKPFELKTPENGHSGIWHMTCTNDSRTFPVGYCATKKCNHKSPEEASDCYRDYCKNEQNGMMAGFKVREDDKRGTVISITSSY